MKRELPQAMGTFYIRRGKGGARPLLERLRPHLLAGGSVCFFPEGTTTDGGGVLDFHPRLFAAAVETSCTVQPVALHYGPAADGTAIAPFIGEDDLLSHLLRLLRSPGLEATISYCAPIGSQGQTREALAQQARAAIAGVIAAAPRVPAPVARPAAAALTV
jgi:1-acyl-sn-glycerol-3-phosphate acyltransferase